MGKAKVSGDGWSYDQIQEMIQIAIGPLEKEVAELRVRVDDLEEEVAELRVRVDDLEEEEISEEDLKRLMLDAVKHKAVAGEMLHCRMVQDGKLYHAWMEVKETGVTGKNGLNIYEIDVI